MWFVKRLVTTGPKLETVVQAKTKIPIQKTNQTTESTYETQNSQKQHSCPCTPQNKSTMKDPLNPQTFETPQSEQIGERRKEI